MLRLLAAAAALLLLCLGALPRVASCPFARARTGAASGVVDLPEATPLLRVEALHNSPGRRGTAGVAQGCLSHADGRDEEEAESEGSEGAGEALLMAGGEGGARAGFTPRSGAGAGADLASSRASARTLMTTPRQQIASCAGVGCPDVSQCVLVNGAPSCRCPEDQYSRLVNNKCTAAPLRHFGYLDPQNHARAAVGSVPLAWDGTLAQQAQTWADQLAAGDNNCKLALGGKPKGVGQNVANFFENSTFRNFQAMELWVQQGARYRYSRFRTTGAAGCATGSWRDCAAYTQVIWNNTRLVGCGVGKCPALQGKVWVCNYKPSGNINRRFPYVRK